MIDTAIIATPNETVEASKEGAPKPGQSARALAQDDAVRVARQIDSLRASRAR